MAEVSPSSPSPQMAAPGKSSACEFPGCDHKFKFLNRGGNVCKSCSQRFCNNHCRHTMFYRDTFLGPRWYLQKTAFSQGEQVKVCFQCFQLHLVPHLDALNPLVDDRVKAFAKRVYGVGTPSALWQTIKLPDSLAPVLTPADTFSSASDSSDSEHDDSGVSSDSSASHDTTARSVRHGPRGGGPWLNDDKLTKLLDSAAAKAAAAGLHIPQSSTTVPVNTPEFETFANAFAPRQPDRLVEPGLACRFCTPLPSRVASAVASATADSVGVAAPPQQGACAAHGGYMFAPVDLSLEPLAPSVSGVWMAALLAKRNTAASVTANRALAARG